jgi:hypothetical protein
VQNKKNRKIRGLPRLSHYKRNGHLEAVDPMLASIKLFPEF